MGVRVLPGPFSCDKLPDMSTLRSFLLESHMPERFVRAVFRALPLVEATNINKQFLLKEAGSPEALKSAKAAVASALDSAQLGGIVTGNLLQKLLNFLYLMEIRQPGFTTPERLHSIHDLALHKSLEQRFLSEVNSDTTPEEASGILDAASAGAARAAKVYPDLTDEEEKVWNRVGTYHEFPDGFKWVYAIGENGQIAGHIPSSITRKTMNHCGNAPSDRPGDEYWELRDSTGKAYLTVILDGQGRIEESKSWGNQTNKYRKKIMPYVKWFLMDRKVTGVGWRYDNGYATHRNFGVKDFMGDDPEFVDYVTENKPELIGNAEARIMFWKGALAEGVVTVDDLKGMFDGNDTMSELYRRIPGLEEYSERAKFHFKADRDESGSDPSAFGLNRFAVLCAICDGNPFTPEELEKLVSEGKLKLAEFANYDIKMLTPEMQLAFVKANPKEMDALNMIAAQVATFDLTPEIWRGLMPADDDDVNTAGKKFNMLLDYLSKANPPSKVDSAVQEVFSSQKMVDYMCGLVACIMENPLDVRARYCYSVVPETVFARISRILGDHPDVPFPRELRDALDVVFARIAELDQVEPHTYAVAIPGCVLGSIKRMGPVAKYVLGLIDERVVAGCIRCVSSDCQESVKVISLLIELVGPDLVSSCRGLLNEEGQLSYVACMPPDEQNREIAIKTVCGYAESQRLTMNLSDYGERDRASMLFLLMYRYPEVTDYLDWEQDTPLMMLNSLLDRYLYSSRDENSFSGQMSADGLVELCRKICMQMVKHRSAREVQRRWSSIGDKMSSILDRCGTQGSQDIADAYRIMCETLMDEYPGNWIPGIASRFVIGLDEWDGMYGKYGSDFVEEYVLHIPNSMFGEAEGRFVYEKLKGMEFRDSRDIIRILDSDRRFGPKKRIVASLLSSGIVSGDFPLNDEMFNDLVDRKFIPADAVRTVMSRKEESGDLTVDSTDSAERVKNTLPRLIKFSGLPGVVYNACKYLLDVMYDHLGDGRVKWRVDEEAYNEAAIMERIVVPLSRKLGSGFAAKAFVALDCPEIRGRLDKFEQANRAACDVPGQPRSKFKSTVVGLVNGMVDCINENIDAAREISAAQDAKPARKSRKKPA